ncbi:MAG: TonB-dependent receptor [Sterolibacterium sp.]|nr:TonB-dependent receptor [Sterolibacterium sp.]
MTDSLRLAVPSPGCRQSLLAVAVLACLGTLPVARAASEVDSAIDRQADQPAATASKQNKQLEEVIITAQKRQESLQQAPLAVSALTERDLEVQRIDHLMNLGNVLPSLVMVPFTGNRAAPNMTIRGMGNIDSQITKDGANGIYIDGVPVGRMVGLAADICDLERIELLRGPQGTLYGRNTTGGAINFITVRPDKALSFSQGLTLANDGLWSSKTRLNLPLTENLYTRLAYTRAKTDGWVKNSHPQPDQINFNEDDKEAVRWTTRLLVNDRLTADLSLDHSKMVYGNVFFQRVAGPTAVPGRQTSANPVLGLRPSRLVVAGHQLTLSWQLDEAVLKSITAWRRMENRMWQNYADVFTQSGDQQQDQLTQEFQLVGSALDKRIEYVLGLFYSRENGEEQLTTLLPSVPSKEDTWRISAESQSTAVYGQLSWRPPVLDDRLRLTVGLRDTHDHRSARKFFMRSDFAPSSDGVVVDGHKRFHKLTPSWTVDYTFNDQLSGYARLAYGYRAGGFNARTPHASFGDGFNQENVRSSEIGLKSQWLVRRLRLNLALFNSKYTDLQVDQVRVPAFFTDTLNAGAAQVDGLEVEARALLGGGWSANFYHTWMKARYGAYVDNGVDLAATKHMPNAPERQGGLSLLYGGERGRFGKPELNIAYNWQSTFYSNPNPETRTNGYGLWNVRAQLSQIRLPQGQLRVAIWGKNLTDREYRLTNTNLGGMTAMYGAPRSIGVDAIFEY